MSDERERLAQCPFCGGTPGVHENDWCEPPEYSVFCECFAHTKGSTDQGKAIAAWNRRAPVPDGWRLVPVEPTEEMMHAARGALKEFLLPIPKEVRVKMFTEMRGRGLTSNGSRVPPRLKITLRYKAMLAAAPQPEETT
jgi:hypothetical protein